MHDKLLRTDDAVEFYADKGKLILYLAATLTITAFGLIPILKPLPTTRGITGGIIVMILFGLISVRLVLALVKSRTPALILTPQSFSFPKAIAEPVSWGAVRDVKTISTGRGDSLLVLLYQEQAEHLTPTGFLCRLHRGSPERRTRVVIPLQLLDDQSNRIPQIFVRKVKASRAQRGLDPDLGPQDDRAEIRSELAASRTFPFFTAALLFLLGLVFLWEVKSATDPLRGLLALSPRMLTADGGLHAELVKQSHQWWRLFTAPLLHGSLPHLISNGIALLLVGILLERVIGHARFAAIFVISALCGSAASLFFNPLTNVGVGASGGILGLFAAAFVVGSRMTSQSNRGILKRRAAYAFALALLPSSSSAAGVQIDYAAHFGGAIGGGAMALLLFRSWPQNRSNVSLMYVTGAIAASYFAIAALSVLPIRQQQHLVTLYQQLAPDWPADLEKAKRRAAEILVKYPRDPRAHLTRAMTLAEGKDLDGAEREMRRVLADREMLSLSRFETLEPNVRYLLAGLLLDLRKRDEAQEIAKPLCGRDLPPSMAEHFRKMALCDVSA